MKTYEWLIILAGAWFLWKHQSKSNLPIPTMNGEIGIGIQRSQLLYPPDQTTDSQGTAHLGGTFVFDQSNPANPDAGSLLGNPASWLHPGQSRTNLLGGSSQSVSSTYQTGPGSGGVFQYQPGTGVL
jgi:hypothetical protein